MHGGRYFVQEGGGGGGHYTLGYIVRGDNIMRGDNIYYDPGVRGLGDPKKSFPNVFKSVLYRNG